MIWLMKKLIPARLRAGIRRLIKAVRYRHRRLRIARAVRAGEPIKVILGAAQTWQAGWYATNEQWLDITRAADWRQVFKGRRMISHVVAEHVFEHLTPDQCRGALRHIHDHLVEGGRLRIAVPDGYNPSEEYRRHVAVGGIGDDADDHKQLLNADSLYALLAEAGFEPRLVEGYDRRGNLVRGSWSPDDGFIRRSRANPDSGAWGFVDANTSLIIDAVKR